MSADSVAMATTWHNYDPAVKSKPRFSYKEIKTLLQAVIRNRHVLLSEYHKEKFNSGASAEAKKQTWQEITDEINGLGENHREVRQIMKKWADLKCDGRRRVNAFHPDRVRIRKKQMGPIERTVHKILMMVPRGGDSDLEIGEDEDLSKLMSKAPGPNAAPYSYLGVTDSSFSLPGANYDLSPLSSPEKEPGDPFHSSPEFDLLDDGDQTLDFEEMDDSFFSSALLPPSSSPSSSLDPLPAANSLQRKPVHTYSRTTSNNPNPIPVPIQNNGGQNHVGNHSYSKPPPLPGPSTSSSMVSKSSASTSDTTGPPKILLTINSSSPISNTAVNNSTNTSSSSTSAFIAPLPPGPIPTSSNSNSNPLSNQSERLPAGASSSNRARDNVAKMASQSLEQQRAGRMLLTSVSRSMETLAQSVQLLVESQQEFVQDSLLLQRETVDILKEFSNTALTMLRDNNNKANNANSAAGQMATRQHHPASHF